MINMMCLKADCDEESAKEQKECERVEWDPALEVKAKFKNPLTSIMGKWKCFRKEENHANSR